MKRLRGSRTKRGEAHNDMPQPFSVIERERVCSHASSRGLTLVEILMVLAIIAVVLAVAFSLLLFGNKSERNIQSQAEERNNIRLVMNALEKKVANANEYALLSAVDSSPGASYIQLYVVTDGSGVGTMMLQADAAAPVALAGASSGIQGLVAAFSVADSTSRTIKVTLTTARGYAVTKDILVQNLPSGFAYPAAPETKGILKLKLP